MSNWDGIKFVNKYEARGIIKELCKGFNQILVDHKDKIITAYNVFPKPKTQVIHV